MEEKIVFFTDENVISICFCFNFLQGRYNYVIFKITAFYVQLYWGYMGFLYLFCGIFLSGQSFDHFRQEIVLLLCNRRKISIKKWRNEKKKHLVLDTYIDIFQISYFTPGIQFLIQKNRRENGSNMVIGEPVIIQNGLLRHPR